jgi:CBS domain containing-hemolysin-like protein
VNGLRLTLTALLIAINAFFVIAEYALVRSRRARLEIMRDEGQRGSQLALRQIDHINDYISAVQIGVTMTSIGIGALGEPALASILKGAFGGLSHDAAVALSAVLAFSMIAAAQLIAGEMVPKFYAIDRAEAVARRVARPLDVFSKVFKPIIEGLTWVSDRILRLLGVDINAARPGGSSDELKRLIAESQEGGHIDRGEAGMLTGVFHLHEQEARQVMTSIPAVVTVDVSQDVQTALRLCVSSGHTRLVVTEDEDRDRVRGLVHVSELASELMKNGPEAPLQPVVHDALIVPETKPLDDLLADLQRQRTSLAVVVDEYGRVVGVTSVEDIIEEVVGEIADETDPTAGEIRRLANGDWLVRGHVVSELGRLPHRGDTVNADGYSIRVESVRENRIEAVRIRERRTVPREQRDTED